MKRIRTCLSLEPVCHQNLDEEERDTVQVQPESQTITETNECRREEATFVFKMSREPSLYSSAELCHLKPSFLLLHHHHHRLVQSSSGGAAGMFLGCPRPFQHITFPSDLQARGFVLRSTETSCFVGF